MQKSSPFLDYVWNSDVETGGPCRNHSGVPDCFRYIPSGVPVRHSGETEMTPASRIYSGVETGMPFQHGNRHANFLASFAFQFRRRNR
jgi:hypothetical protein